MKLTDKEEDKEKDKKTQTYEEIMGRVFHGKKWEEVRKKRKSEPLFKITHYKI